MSFYRKHINLFLIWQFLLLPIVELNKPQIIKIQIE